MRADRPRRDRSSFREQRSTGRVRHFRRVQKHGDLVQHGEKEKDARVDPGRKLRDRRHGTLRHLLSLLQ